MKKNLGFTRFEFYFVVSVIGLIVLVAAQRFSLLAEETKRLTFEALAKNFTAAVYNHHARWIMAQQPTKVSLINIDGAEIYFSPQGWPLLITVTGVSPVPMPIKNCLSLWNNLLQKPPSISYKNGSVYGTLTYHLSLTPEGKCRFELITKHPQEYYFDYMPTDGQVTIYSPPITKNP